MAGLASPNQAYGLPLIFSLHPRTHSLGKAAKVMAGDRVRFVEPLNFFDFVALEQQAKCVLSDSGTVQEECCLFGVPNVTLRDVTERPETVEVRQQHAQRGRGGRYPALHADRARPASGLVAAAGIPGDRRDPDGGQDRAGLPAAYLSLGIGCQHSGVERLDAADKGLLH